MGHSIQGFVGRADHLREVVDEAPGVRVIDLSSGFAFLPATEEVLDWIRTRQASLPQGPVGRGDDQGDWDWGACPMLFPEDAQFARWLSLTAPVAWVETDYFGGRGWQSAAAWRDGEVVVGPSKTGTGIPTATDAINQALRAIGVVRSTGDEFDTLGLGRFRSNEDWLDRG